jgi:hypothetical protein
MGIQTQDGYLSGLMPDILADFERKAREEKYFDNPTLWAKDKLGVTLWYKQTEVADALAVGAKKSVAVRAGHGVGKSFLSAMLACWFVDTRPIQYVFVASTAPSADQVTAILWREIRNAHALSHKRYAEFLRLKGLGHDTQGLPDRPLPGRITSDNKWKDDLGNLIAQGRKPPDHNEDAFQGIHAQYVLAIGDEACGLNANMVDSLSNITTNANSRRLLIANPTNPRSRFGEIFLDTEPREVKDENGNSVRRTLQDAWSLHHISVLDSPNFHGHGICDPECPLFIEHSLLPPGLGLDKQALESLTDMSYVTEKQLEYGVDSARYKARVQGEFAYDSANNLFTDIIMGRARDATCYISTEPGAATTVLGYDVARSETGDTSYVYSFTTGEMKVLHDETGEPLPAVFGIGGRLRFVDKYRGVPLVDTYDAEGKFYVGQATLVHQHAINLGARQIRVDSGGMGVGVIDALRFLGIGKYVVVEMQSGGPTPDSRSWYRNRDYQFDQMAKRFGKGLIDIDPSDKTLLTQLEDILYEFIDPHGALKIESKDSMKKRGVKSPDAADAAWYACADLRHLDGPKDGDVLVKSPDQVMKELILSGYIDPYPF